MARAALRVRRALDALTKTADAEDVSGEDLALYPPLAVFGAVAAAVVLDGGAGEAGDATAVAPVSARAVEGTAVTKTPAAETRAAVGGVGARIAGTRAACALSFRLSAVTSALLVLVVFVAAACAIAVTRAVRKAVGTTRAVACAAV